MTFTIELTGDLKDRLAVHLNEDETYEQFSEELLNMNETGGTLLQEGYSE